MAGAGRTSVLHVMESVIGGTRRHLVDVARGQLELGLDVAVVASCERAPDAREDLAELGRRGARVVELPMVRPIAPRRDLAHAAALRRLLRELRPAIVHTHSSKAGVLGRHASLATGIGRRVHTPHTFAFLFEAVFSPAKRRLFRAIETWYGRRTDRMIAVSESEGAAMRASGVIAPERVRVVPNGIDPAPWRAAEPLARAELGVPEDAPLAAVVGLIYAAKGQDLAVRALREPGCEGVHLLVAGAGEAEGACRALARELDVDARAHFLGWRRDVPALLATADFLVLPSRWEGMPYVVIEAMCAGRPVVASAVDGARDLVVEGETGTLAAIGSAASLGAAMRRLVERDPAERARMGARAAERAERGYSAEAMVAGLARVYEELA